MDINYDTKLLIFMAKKKLFTDLFNNQYLEDAALFGIFLVNVLKINFSQIHIFV